MINVALQKMRIVMILNIPTIQMTRVTTEPEKNRI